jgi:hypothetical protein
MNQTYAQQIEDSLKKLKLLVIVIVPVFFFLLNGDHEEIFRFEVALKASDPQLYHLHMQCRTGTLPVPYYM